MPKQLYTIGYGGRRPQDFVEALLACGVRTVVDVRLRPDRAHLGTFVKANSPDKGIERVLNAVGIQYRALPELGNVFREVPAWESLYSELIKRAGDMLTARVHALEDPLCLLCAERDVQRCHRRQIADYLAGTGYDVEHIA